VVHLWAQYDVEPARRVDVLFDRVYTEPWTPDGEIELERVVRGYYEIDAAGEGRFRRFLARLAPLFDRATAQPARPTRASKERAARLRRIAEHFLTAGENAYAEGEVLSEFNADAVLHYVIALEAVVAATESDKTELTRKVVQRAAVLAGVNDEDRAVVAQTIRAAYASRSAYAHGREPSEIDLPILRRIVRDCMLAQLILGESSTNAGKLADVADAALLDHALLAKEGRAPIAEFWAGVHGS
jgi:Apea-like HEPN